MTVRSVEENTDEFGRIPFHLNPAAYTRPENYITLTLVLTQCPDVWLYWHSRRGTTPEYNPSKYPDQLRLGF